MNIFSREKDLVQRFLNLILVIWIVGAIIFAYSNLVDLVFDYNAYTYDEYREFNCKGEFSNCENNYNSYKYDIKSRRNDTTKGLIESFGNIVIVSGFLFFVNKNKM